MGLNTFIAAHLVPMLRPGQRIASMGYPDLVAPEIEVLKWLGKKEIEYRKDSAAICKRHSLSPQRIPDTHSFFDAFGVKLDVYDIVQERGNEILMDLNEPQEPNSVYDYVLDVGTIEHCFNIGQAAKTMAGMLNVGGTIFHGNPFVMGNHGFYGLNPTWYADFYGQHGMQLIWCKMKRRNEPDFIEASRTERFSFEGSEIEIYAAARRTELMPIGWPMQTKYKLMGAA